MKNERLPLRTVVQVLFFDQERGSKETSHKLLTPELSLREKQTQSSTGDDGGKLKLGPDEKVSRRNQDMRRTTIPGTSDKDQHKMKKSDGKLPAAMERKLVIGETAEEVESEKGKEVREEGMARSKLHPKKIERKGGKLDHS